MAEENKLNHFKGTRRLVVMALAVVLSVILWGHYKLAGTITVDVYAKINFKVSDETKFRALACLTNTTTEIERLKLTVSCSKLDMDFLRNNDYVALIDLSQETQKNMIPAFELKKDMMVYFGPPSLKSKFSVIDIEPKRLRVVVDNIVDRNLPVTLDLKGKLEEGYAILQTNIAPSVVTVRGAEESIAKMTDIVTEPINIEALNKNLENNYRLIVPENAEARNRVVKIRLRIGRAPAQLPIKGLMIERFGTPQNDLDVAFIPSTVQINVEVPQDEIDQFKQTEIRAFVDVGNLAPSEYTLPIQVIPPRIGRVKDIIPKTIQVIVGTQRD